MARGFGFVFTFIFVFSPSYDISPKLVAQVSTFRLGGALTPGIGPYPFQSCRELTSLLWGCFFGASFGDTVGMGDKLSLTVSRWHRVFLMLNITSVSFVRI